MVTIVKKKYLSPKNSSRLILYNKTVTNPAKERVSRVTEYVSKDIFKLHKIITSIRKQTKKICKIFKKSSILKNKLFLPLEKIDNLLISIITIIISPSIPSVLNIIWLFKFEYTIMLA